MGLDMYLFKTHSVNGNDLARTIGREEIDVTSYFGDSHINVNNICEIKEEVGYWRKANAIHEWFVQNVQKGEDDCGTYWVSYDKIKELLRVCMEIKLDHTKAEKLLPTQEGFFFGSTEYDKWYFNSIDDTIKILTDLEESDDYYYHSSW